MKAAQINAYGDASVVKVAEADKPTLKASQVLVEVHAASLNPFDSMVRSGALKDMIPLQFPTTLGGDIAGVVVEVGDAVTNLRINDKVFGQANAVAGNSGALAEYAATAASQITQMPDKLEFDQAAALPLVGVSALQAITEHIQLKSGQKILVHGGGGGIGAIAIQIAKNIGAYVATTATGDDIDYVKQLGADQVIDYKSQDFAAEVKNFDAVFDTVGGNDFDKCLTVLKRGGIAVSMIATADEAKATKLGVDTLTQSTKVTTERLNELRQLVESGVVSARIGKVFPIDQIKAAFEARESGSVKGKVVVELR